MPTRKWGAEKLVNTTTAGNQGASQVTALADGGFVTVWQDDSGAHSAIRGQRFDAAGNRVGGEIAIDVNPGNDEVLPAVAGLADGGFYVTWTQLVGPDNYILGSVYNDNGTFVRNQPAVFAVGKDTDAKVAGFGDGAAVVWEDPDADDGGIDFRIFDAAGNGGKVLIAHTILAGEPDLAARPDGTMLAIVWADAGGIEASLRTPNGTEFGPQFRIDAPAGSLGVFDPHVAWLNNDQFVVVWRQFNSFKHAQNEIKARIFDGQDILPVELTGNIAVNSTTADSQQNPTVTALPNGGFVVAWEDNSGIGLDGDFAVRLQAFDGAGGKIGGEITVNTATAGGQFGPSVAALADGRVVVSWTDASRTGGDPGGTAIRMQIVDPRDGIVTGTPAADTLYGHDLVNDEITAGVGNDALFGLRGDDALYGDDGQDRLDGGAGGDLMYGGPGNDTYFVDNAGDVVSENPGEGTDTIRTALPRYTLGANVENLVFTGAGNFIGTGNALGNAIIGDAGADALSGGSGNDTLNGGTGADRMAGGRDNDIYVVGDAGDVVIEAAGQGTDTVRPTLRGYTLGANVENLVFIGAGNFAGTGNALANSLTGGRGNDTLDGRAGADRMAGGLGNDIYIVDTGGAGDVVIEATGQGADTVKTSLSSYALGANVENLVFTGSGNFTGAGNGLANRISGGAGSNTLSGGGGADTLVVGRRTAVTGGGGNDLFLLTTPGTPAAPDINKIADFAHRADRLGLRDAGFNLGVNEGKGTSTPRAIAASLLSTRTNGTFATSGNRFAYNNATGAFYYDADGSGAGGARQLVATLTTHPILTASDIFFTS